jgi:hypothetical protein
MSILRKLISVAASSAAAVAILISPAAGLAGAATAIEYSTPDYKIPCTPGGLC